MLGPRQAALAAGVRRWLGAHHRWLLVLDNPPGPDEVRALISRARGGHVPSTSCGHYGWDGLAAVCPLETLSRAESIQLLTERTGDGDARAAQAIADALGDLPLALEQAAAYVEATGLPLAGYEARLRGHAPQLFAPGGPANYEHTVASTWELAFREVEQDVAVRSVLLCSAVLAPERIPGELFASELVADGAFAGPDGRLALDHARERLLCYSLLTRTEELGMHHLVQEVVRARLGPEGRRWAETALALVEAAFPANCEDPSAWPTCERLLPHGLAVAENAEAAGTENETTTRLLGQIGLYLHSRGEYRQAEAAQRLAWDLSRRVLGEEHPDTLTSMANLALTLWSQGELAGARALHERALEVSRRVLGEEQPDTLTSMNNLAETLRRQGELAGARALHERALEASRRVLGEEHPDTLGSMSNLAETLGAQGEQAEACALQERALEASRRVLGEEHPGTILARGRLARLEHRFRLEDRLLDD